MEEPLNEVETALTPEDFAAAKNLKEVEINDDQVPHRWDLKDGDMIVEVWTNLFLVIELLWEKRFAKDNQKSYMNKTASRKNQIGWRVDR